MNLLPRPRKVPPHGELFQPVRGQTFQYQQCVLCGKVQKVPHLRSTPGGHGRGMWGYGVKGTRRGLAAAAESNHLKHCVAARPAKRMLTTLNHLPSQSTLDLSLTADQVRRGQLSRWYRLLADGQRQGFTEAQVVDLYDAGFSSVPSARWDAVEFHLDRWTKGRSWARADLPAFIPPEAPYQGG